MDGPRHLSLTSRISDTMVPQTSDCTAPFTPGSPGPVAAETGSQQPCLSLGAPTPEVARCPSPTPMQGTPTCSTQAESQSVREQAVQSTTQVTQTQPVCTPRPPMAQQEEHVPEQPTHNRRPPGWLSDYVRE